MLWPCWGLPCSSGPPSVLGRPWGFACVPVPPHHFQCLLASVGGLGRRELPAMVADFFFVSVQDPRPESPFFCHQSRTSSSSITWELVRSTELQVPCSDLMNQDVHFDEIPWGSHVHFEKGCFTQSLFLYLLSAFSFFFFLSTVFFIMRLRSFKVKILWKQPYLNLRMVHTYLN